MSDTRKKATMPQVLADIKPYLTKRFLSEPVIDDKNLPVICQTLLCRYSNVKLVQGVTNNKPNLRIPWSSIPQELQQPLRRYVAQADGKLCGYCKEDLCNTENGRMIVELYLGKQEQHVSRILY